MVVYANLSILAQQKDRACLPSAHTGGYLKLQRCGAYGKSANAMYLSARTLALVEEAKYVLERDTCLKTLITLVYGRLLCETEKALRIH